jgi:hypothetical protein
MALNIDGTTGISGVDGSASAPALTGTDSNTGINFASDTVNINTGGSTRATVDSSGRMLIGTTTEGVSGADELTVATSGDTGITIRSGSSNSGKIFFSDATSGAGEYTGGFEYAHGDNSMRFFTNNGSERLRLGSDGFLGIGVTSEVTTGGGSCFINASDARKTLILGTNTSGTRTLLAFQTSQGSAGYINVSGSTTAYNTSSDYRLKENVVAISDGITRLKTLKPCRFNFIADATKTVDGFLAHEVTAVPEAISGTKDQVVTQDLVNSGDRKESELGDPVYQGIDQSKLVPLLTAALQEAVAKIEVLETKVAALEAA